MTSKLPFLSDEHHYAITNMAIRVGQMDWHIECLVRAALLLQPETAEYILRNMAADRIIGIARAILLDSFPKDAEKINQLFDKIEAIRTDRNELLHWIWGRGHEEGTAVHISARPFREQKLKTKTAADIELIANDAMQSINTLIWWENEAHARALPSLRQMSWSLVPQPSSPDPSEKDS